MNPVKISNEQISEERVWRERNILLALLCLCSRFEAGSGSNVAVLVTAPKDPLFLVKSESTERLRRLRQIRVLVFSDKNIVKVSLDGSEKGGSA